MRHANEFLSKMDLSVDHASNIFVDDHGEHMQPLNPTFTLVGLTRGRICTLS